ncbi:DUF799 family lipoprotein [Orbaceae bacterium ESL0721]|nr:DUF799 family lipoprotein [Orbaceae bacterium ESL0721]
MVKMIKLIGILSMLFLITACGSNYHYDYTAFKNSNPKSILVLPPINNTVEVDAINGVYSFVTRPLAESGYYVLPVTLVNEILKQNGITTSEDAREISLPKLHQIFNADAILYITIDDYGTSYKVISSDTNVAVSAILVDAKTGQELWRGSASASSSENSNNDNYNLISMVITAAVKQVITTSTDGVLTYADTATYRLLNANGENKILYGPRSSHYRRL